MTTLCVEQDGIGLDHKQAAYICNGNFDVGLMDGQDLPRVPMAIPRCCLQTSLPMDGKQQADQRIAERHWQDDHIQVRRESSAIRSCKSTSHWLMRAVVSWEERPPLTLSRFTTTTDGEVGGEGGC